MIMSGQMKNCNYTEPIMLSQITNKIDLRGLFSYAKEKGVKVSNLSDEEKKSFMSVRERFEKTIVN